MLASLVRDLAVWGCCRFTNLFTVRACAGLLTCCCFSLVRSAMKQQGNVGICPRSWSTFEESWVSRVTQFSFQVLVQGTNSWDRISAKLISMCGHEHSSSVSGIIFFSTVSDLSQCCFYVMNWVTCYIAYIPPDRELCRSVYLINNVFIIWP